MSFATVKLLGFAPDVPTDTPGAITSQQGMIPTPKGFSSGPVQKINNTAQMDANSRGVFSAKKVDGTRRYWAGSSAKLWEITSLGVTLTDRSGSAYTASATQTWSFCQFGDVTLASNKGNTIQQINAGASFAAVAGAPKASIIITAGPATAPFILAFNYNDGSDNPDGLFNSGLADYTGWTVGVNQCATLRAYEPAGGFVAAIKYRDGALAFKDDAMFEVIYNSIAATPGWSFRRIASDVGCCGKNMCVNINDTIYFADKRGFWMYDGSYPKKIPGYVNDYWSSLVGSSANDLSQMVWDPLKHNLWISVGTAAQASTWLVWNQISGLWSKQGTVNVIDGSANVVGTFQIVNLDPTPVVTVNGVGATDSIVDGWTYNSSILAGTTNQSPQMKLWYIGDPIGYTEITRVAPVWLGSFTPSSTSSCTLDGFKSQNGSSVQTVGPTTIDSNRLYFDVMLSANWIQVTLIGYGSYEFGSVGISSGPSGKRGTR